MPGYIRVENREQIVQRGQIERGRITKQMHVSSANYLGAVSLTQSEVSPGSVKAS